MEKIEETIQAVKNGDLSAYRGIVQNFQGMAFGCAYGVLNDYQLAEDAAQEAFVDACGKLESLRDPNAFPGWFKKILLTHCNRIARKNRFDTTSLELTEEPSLPDDSPDKKLEKAEMREWILNTVRSLPEQLRITTTLFYISGYSQKEISDFLEVPVSTVKKRLHDSRRKLKTDLTERRFDEMVAESMKQTLPERFADVVMQMTFVAERINPLAEKFSELSDAEMKSMSCELRSKIQKNDRDKIKAEAFALVREASRRSLGMSHFDIQLAGSMIMDEGNVAQITTGEGKSILCYPALYMATLEGRKVHLATVNGYLADRDSKQAAKVFSFLGVSVGCIDSTEPGTEERRKAYDCDITYGTYTEFAFDYLIESYDNSENCNRDYMLIDEIDSILVNEGDINCVLTKGESEDFEESFDSTAELPKKDLDYLVEDGKIRIIDPFLGRIRGDMGFANGMQQVLEKNENIKKTQEYQKLGEITLLDFFRKYKILTGMSGTADLSEELLKKQYGLEVVAVPTRRETGCIRYEDKELPDKGAMLDELLKEVIHQSRELKKPVLVACPDLPRSEKVSGMLKRYDIPHSLLNARSENAEKEAEIVADSGTLVTLPNGEKTGKITVATPMMGEGTDIQVSMKAVCSKCIDPAGSVKCCMKCQEYSPEDACADCFKSKLHAEFPEKGRYKCRKDVPCGLHVIGVGRHPSKRVDEQFALRAGRQGLPGSCRFLVTPEDMELTREEYLKTLPKREIRRKKDTV